MLNFDGCPGRQAFLRLGVAKERQGRFLIPVSGGDNMSLSTQDERMHVECPRCGQQLRVRLRNMGKHIKCKACRFRFTAPKQSLSQWLLAVNADKVILGMILVLGCGLLTIGWYFGEAFGVPPYLGAILALFVSVLVAFVVHKVWVRFE